MMPLLKAIYRIYRATGIALHPVKNLRAIARFSADRSAFRRMNDNPNFRESLESLYPCLADRTESTPLDATYFFQDTWAAGKIFALRPDRHVDVGSSAMTVGIVSRFVATTMVDIRPLPLVLPGLSFREGSILALPFADGSVTSLSSLCVVEHIGLGRYGDPLDPWGSEKAARELQRVLAPGGNLLMSVPVDGVNRVYFNAHRAFTRAYVVELFHDLNLVDELYIYGDSTYPAYDADRKFGTGLFHFRKEADAR